MSATAERPRTARPKITREEAADQLSALLTEEPQTLASLRRQILGRETKGGKDDSIRAGLSVLESRNEAKQIQGRGWVVTASEHQAAIETPQTIDWPFSGGTLIRLDQMFVDKSYQRPLTNFVTKIVNEFDPDLWQTLTLADRGDAAPKGKRYSLIDGQTRWSAGTKLGIVEAPCIIFSGISPEKEADLFARIQKERKGMVSWHRFRAQLRAKRADAVAIFNIVTEAGYTMGDGAGQLKAIGALESAFKRDEFLLARALADLKAAWPETIPEAPHIKGLHALFRNYPIGDKRRKPKGHVEVINDERLVRRLKSAGPESLKRKASAVKESLDGRGTAEGWMAQAMQNVYLGSSR